MLLAADGRTEFGPSYRALAEGSRVACYTPLVGSMPAAPGFDLAAAALMLNSGRVFASPQPACSLPATVAQAGPLASARISCLTLAESSGFGQVELGRLSNP